MRVSVVIPVHDRQALCERALRSALAQDIDGLEAIVVDDGSQPPFRLPEDVEKSVVLIREPQNRGASAARNAGVAAAKADWIAFLDSDDYWLPRTLAPRLAAAEARSKGEPLTVYAAGFLIRNLRTGRRAALMPIESNRPIDFASGCWFSPGSTILFRKAAFDQVGPYDVNLRRLEDLDWFLRLALTGGRLKVWNDVAAVIETGGKPRLSTLEDAAARLLAKYSSSEPPLSPEMLQRLRAYLDIERASVFAAEGRWLKMLTCMTRSMRQVPRRSLHLERFWRSAPMPQHTEPAGRIGDSGTTTS